MAISNCVLEEMVDGANLSVIVSALSEITEWPNKLGYDVGDAEVWKHASAFRVFTPTRVLLVPYSVTTNPETAVTLCREHGLSRAALDDMDPRDAEQLFQSTRPAQRELF